MTVVQSGPIIQARGVERRLLVLAPNRAWAGEHRMVAVSMPPSCRPFTDGLRERRARHQWQA